MKTSYFPNWQVSGGKGPYRVAPNLMVVIPTSDHVSLHFGRTGVDYLAILLTLLGLMGLVGMARLPAIVIPEPKSWFRAFGRGDEAPLPPGAVGFEQWLQTLAVGEGADPAPPASADPAGSVQSMPEGWAPPEGDAAAAVPGPEVSSHDAPVDAASSSPEPGPSAPVDDIDRGPTGEA